MSTQNSFSPILLSTKKKETGRRLIYLYQLLWGLIADVPDDCRQETLDICDKVEKLLDKLKSS